MAQLYPDDPNDTELPLDSPTSLPFMQPPSGTWDPFSSGDWDKEKPLPQCIHRMKRDIFAIYQDPPPGMVVVPEEDDVTRVHALITGPDGTPYENGFFYFYFRFPNDYPLHPPRVRIMTTGNGCVRFNPNLYKNGKVCLSILGTWVGPSWSPAQSLSSILISIQSLLNDKPYHNEPGFEEEHRVGDVSRYNECIRHETLRVAVCDTLEGRVEMPSQLKTVVQQQFSVFADDYISTAREHRHLNNHSFQDPFGDNRGSFDYDSILRRLTALSRSHPPTESLPLSENSPTSERPSLPGSPEQPS